MSKNRLKVGQGERRRLQLGDHVFDGVKVVEAIVEINALDLWFTVDGGYCIEACFLPLFTADEGGLGDRAGGLGQDRLQLANDVS